MKAQVRDAAIIMNKPIFSFDGESLITPDLISAESVGGQPSANDDFAAKKAILDVALDKALSDFQNNLDPRKIIQETVPNLHDLRKSSSPAVWQQLMEAGRQHAVLNYFLLDPFTRWSYVKPRGYSGDAQLLDFIYYHPSVGDEVARASKLGRLLYDYTSKASSSVAVRERRDILTRYVDSTANKSGKETEILAIACGNLREAALSSALYEHRIKRWVALDQDPISVDAVSKEYPGTVIEAVEGSVRTLLTNRHDIGEFDLVYASGLYDYLIDKVAIKLTKKCLQMLKPGGSFLFANFANDIRVDGYMEMIMNWALLLRDEHDMWRIIEQSIDGEQGDYEAKVFYGDNRNVIYGVISKIA